MGNFVYFLAFALTGTAVFGRVFQENKDFVEFNIEAKETQSSEDYAVAVDLGSNGIKSGNDFGNRMVSKQYVNAIKNSKLWNEVKTKALSAKGPTELAATFAKYESLPVDQWPDTIIDEVQKICQEGLKCVVMDQLYMMSQFLKTETNGDQSLRTVITKVTNVLSEYKKCTRNLYSGTVRSSTLRTLKRYPSL
ncbi:uncharacterized protein LOC126835716 [Adelges cooleyi]|uniref:uncharacterized protein LOC126835716 n=1 Tax=Adelges cooleyi TaxID=133065 RepID=UPI00217FAD3A|nr:uncharacterized protein LOC126835716 [Adelges cooleyi]